MGNSAKNIAIVVVLTALAITGIGIGLKHQKQATPGQDDKNYLALFTEVLTIVKKSYVDEVDQKKLIQGAVEGMLAHLDPHSAYLQPEPYSEMRISMAGSFGGLGIEINIKDDKLTVISPIEDTPAYRAGIKSNDHIWKIDDKLTKGLTINQAVNLMRGQKGTKVTLHIIREGVQKPLVFPLVRDIIKTKSLRARTIEPGYGYVRISQFQERTGQDFATALQTLHTENPAGLKGLILDLRNNPGGLVDTAVQVVDPFIGEGRSDGTVVYTKGRTPGSKKSYYARIGTKEPHYPMVVLINGGSASASEIIAGALQDHQRAIIMGTQSYGKGSVQSVMSLKDGAGLKLTTARYYTPKGRSIQAKGITPDIIVSMMDPARKKAEPPPGGEIKETKELDLPHHLSAPGVAPKPAGKPAPTAPTAPKVPLVPPAAAVKDAETARDFQLSRAVEMLKGLQVFGAMSSATRPHVVHK
ncbi:MAG TPA: S41 family peptidase [Geobacteraceae bacterium]